MSLQIVDNIHLLKNQRNYRYIAIQINKIRAYTQFRMLNKTIEDPIKDDLLAAGPMQQCLH